MRRGIAPYLTDARILDAHSLHWRFARLAPMRVTRVIRHGKWMFLLGPQRTVSIHLGMSGRFVAHGPLHRHLRWCMLTRRDGVETLLQFVDPRVMGRLRVLTPDQAAAVRDPMMSVRGCPELGLGPDVMCRTLRDGGSLAVRNRWRTMLSVPMEVKRLLMAQGVVAGLGNIYAAEACWLARVSPFRRACDLSDRQLRALCIGIPRMLQLSLILGGTSIGDANSFRDARGAEGRAVRAIRVYGRAGRPCARCGETIERTRQNGRTTHWCPGCQS